MRLGLRRPAGMSAAMIALLLLLLSPAPTRGHGGGTPRLTAAGAGPYRVYAWTEPEPWRVGEVHLSVAVTLPADQAQGDGAQTGAQVETPVTDADITVTFAPAPSQATPGETIRVQAVRQTLLNDYYFEADTSLPSPGLWQVNIEVDGAAGSGSAGFEIEALEARTVNWTLVAAAGAVLLVLVILMGLWSRRQSTPDPRQRPVRRTPPTRPARRPTGR